MHYLPEVQSEGTTNRDKTKLPFLPWKNPHQTKGSPKEAQPTGVHSQEMFFKLFLKLLCYFYQLLSYFYRVLYAVQKFVTVSGTA